MPSTGSPKTRQHRETERFRGVSRELAQKLRALREARGWTIEQAAEKMNVEPAQVARMEAGTANPSLAVLVDVANAFGMSVKELL